MHPMINRYAESCTRKDDETPITTLKTLRLRGGSAEFTGS